MRRKLGSRRGAESGHSPYCTARMFARIHRLRTEAVIPEKLCKRRLTGPVLAQRGWLSLIPFWGASQSMSANGLKTVQCVHRELKSSGLRTAGIRMFVQLPRWRGADDWVWRVDWRAYRAKSPASRSHPKCRAWNKGRFTIGFSAYCGIWERVMPIAASCGSLMFARTDILRAICIALRQDFAVAAKPDPNCTRNLETAAK